MAEHLEKFMTLPQPICAAGAGRGGCTSLRLHHSYIPWGAVSRHATEHASCTCWRRRWRGGRRRHVRRALKGEAGLVSGSPPLLLPCRPVHLVLQHLAHDQALITLTVWKIYSV